MLLGAVCAAILVLPHCTPDPISPAWQAEFIAFADTSSSYPSGSGLSRCFWMDQWVYLVENPLSSCVACEVITVQGDTMALSNSTEQADYLENRRNCEQVWVKQ